MLLNSSSQIAISSFLAFFGGAMVIVGVVLEASELIVKWGKRRIFRKWVGEVFEKHRRQKIVLLVKFLHSRILPFETIGFSLLFIGLAIEFAGSFSAEILQSRENADLESTNLAFAKQMLELAGQMQNTSKSVEQTRTALIKGVQTNVRNIFGKSSSDRTISAEQETNLVNLLKPWLDSHILDAKKVVVDASADDPEAVSYASRIADVLKECGRDVELNTSSVILGGLSGIKFGFASPPSPFVERVVFVFEVLGFDTSNPFDLVPLPHPRNWNLSILIGHKPEK